MPVTLTCQEELAILTLDRQAALNALNFDTLRELSQRIDEVGASNSRALLLTGAGGTAFCAGADIKELMGRTLRQQREGTRLGQAVFDKLENLSVPSIAVIDGIAFGGGLELALACTFRIATARSKLGLPEIKLGLIPGYGGTQRLPRLVGYGKAMEMIATGTHVSGEEAARIGLVHRIAGEQPLGDAMCFAREFTGFSTLALTFARAAVQRSYGMPLAQGLLVECDLITQAFQSRDAAEGMRAFVEKRAPRFMDN